jgi:hypothetical protein
VIRGESRAIRSKATDSAEAHVDFVATQPIDRSCDVERQAQ